MRVISGFLKGRNIDGFNIDGTRPTMDRVKESIFSIIQSYIKDSTVLDLFSGSGNLGIECISNLCNKCYFVDNNIKSISIIKKNVNDMSINDQSIIIKDDYVNALHYFKNNKIKFDIVFLDPPYKKIVIDEVINYLLKNDLLNEEAIIICEYENSSIKKEYNELSLFKEKKYGSKEVTIFKKII